MTYNVFMGTSVKPCRLTQSLTSQVCLRRFFWDLVSAQAAHGFYPDYIKFDMQEVETNFYNCNIIL